MPKANRIFRILILSTFIISLLLIFTACQKVEKISYVGIGDSLTYSCSYNSETDTTYVVFSSNINNPTIYNLTSASFKFDLYKNGSFVRTTDLVDYSIFIEHGNSSNVRFNFTANGDIDAININSWTSDYSSFWETYKIWMIVFIVILSIAYLIYVIVMIVNYLDFEDILDFVKDNIWLLVTILPSIGIGVYSIVSDNWVPFAIAGGSLVAFVLLVLLTELIKFIVCLIADYIPSYGAVNNFDVDELKSMTVQELKDFCKEIGITGYSSLNKQQIIDLIDNIVNGNDISETTNTEPVENKKKTIDTSKITFEDIAGLDNVKEAFREKVIMPFEHPELFEKYGKKSGGGILLYGLPGTGKTMFAEAASNEIDALFIPIKCSDIKSKWYGESEQRIKEIFDKAKKATRAIIFFDEFEAIGAKRNDNSDNGNNDLVPEILAEMQGVGSSNSNSTIVVIAATNKPWSIDSAFLRPGRFDEKIFISLPDYDARKKLFKLQLSKLPTDNIDYDYLANITEGFNGADIKEFCEKLKLVAIKTAISSNKDIPITMDFVHQVEKNIKSSVIIDEISLLKDFESNF